MWDRIQNKGVKTCFIPHTTFGTYDTGKKIIDECTILVFNNLEILNSYKKIFNNKDLILVDRNSLIRITCIIIRSKVVYTAHECCWLNLDLALFLTQKKHTHIVTFSMEGYEKIKSMGYYKISSDSKFQNFLQNLSTMFISIFFDVYWYISGSNKNHLIRNISIKNKFIRREKVLQNSQALSIKKNKPSGKILVNVSLLGLDMDEQINHYNNILENLEKVNCTIYIKNHIRKNLQFDIGELDLSNLGKKVFLLPADEAAEHLIDKNLISYVVSVASSTLAYPKIKGISTIELLNCDEIYKKFRKDNLESQALKNDTAILYITKWSDLTNYLK